MELPTIKSDHKSMGPIKILIKLIPIKILTKTKWMHWTDTPHLLGRAGGGGPIPSVHFLQSTHNFGRQAFKLLTNNLFCKIKIAVSNFFLQDNLMACSVDFPCLYNRSELRLNVNFSYINFSYINPQQI